ncbi:hypothetical protein QBC41DRAFT_134431 [Cercophora samala]|uniref:C2H2-type domain-containing protein n=1 Tax=Cercophora samala TaxID=330535 RepID=A0AA39ZB59_9PEZI|nr:hypothetical protein QBC41DRAFT_134431 [Cercophora samala]
MLPEDKNQDGTLGWAWCRACGQPYFNSLPENITTATTTEASNTLPTSGSHHNTGSIACAQWQHPYDLQLWLSAMTLEENHFTAATEQNSYLSDVSSHQSPNMSLVLDTTGSRESSFSPPQPSPLPFMMGSFVYDTDLFPPLISTAPLYQDQPGPQVSGRHIHYSPGKCHREKKKETTAQKRLNPDFQCIYPGCDLNLRETRALNRHIWSEHREWAQQNNVVRLEEIKCPFPGCTRRGRKDNIMRHFRTKHTAS